VPPSSFSVDTLIPSFFSIWKAPPLAEDAFPLDLIHSALFLQGTPSRRKFSYGLPFPPPPMSDGDPFLPHFEQLEGELSFL